MGKSTLVNRVLGRRETIVEERPGVTRDRKLLEAEWVGRDFTLVDTGGWQVGGMALDKLVSAQAQRAIEEADAVLFVVDVTVGPTQADADVARLLVRSGRPVVLAVNKVDTPARELDIWDFAGLGFAQPWPVSALHGRGTGDLLDALVEVLPPEGEDRVGPPGGLDRGGGAGTDGPATSALRARRLPAEARRATARPAIAWTGRQPGDHLGRHRREAQCR